MFLCKDCIENELTIGFLVDYLQIYIIDIDSIYNPDLRGRVMQYVHDLIPYPVKFICCV